MTNEQIRFIAERKLALHWIKLYSPKRIYEWETKKSVEKLPDENTATWTAMNFMSGDDSLGFRLLTLIQAIDIRETRQLCLGEAIPDSILDEAVRLREEADELLASCEKKYADSSGE